MKLTCPDCETEQIHEIRPWQTGNGVFGALSIMCSFCHRLSIAKLAELPELKLPEIE